MNLKIKLGVELESKITRKLNTDNNFTQEICKPQNTRNRTHLKEDILYTIQMVLCPQLFPSSICTDLIVILKPDNLIH